MIIYPITIPGGSDTHYQYNNGGIFGGSAHATINDATGVSVFTGATVTNCAVLGSDSAIFKPNVDAVDFFQIKNAAGTVTPLNIDTINNQVTVGLSSAAYPFVIKSADASDQIRFYHTNSIAHLRWTDGSLILSSDEGVNTTTVVEIKGKGTLGGQLKVWNPGETNFIRFYSTANFAQVEGIGGTAFAIQQGAEIPVLFFQNAIEGEKQKIRIFGFGTDSGGKESLDISVEQYDVANTAFFEGLDNYLFAGNLITKNFTHENTDGGGETRWIGKREDGAGTETEAGQIEISHDGVGVNDQLTKMTLGVNTGAGVVDVIEIDSSANTKIGDAGTTNYTKIEADGTIEFNGAATVFRDLNIGAATLSGPPGLQPGIVNFIDESAGDTGIATYGLAVGEGFSGQFEMQHDYKEGSNIVFHVHWQGIAAPTGTDKVQFQLTYTVGVSDATLDAVTTITVEEDFDAQYEFKRSNFSAIVGTNINIEDQFMFTLQRIAASADEYGGEALIATVGVHYECDTHGSRTIAAK